MIGVKFADLPVNFLKVALENGLQFSEGIDHEPQVIQVAKIERALFQLQYLKKEKKLPQFVWHFPRCR